MPSSSTSRFIIAAVTAWLPMLPPVADAGEMAGDGGKVKLKIEKPQDGYGNTFNCLLAPPDITVRLERPGEPPAVMVPVGTKLLSRGKPVTSSDKNILIGALDLITNGDKEAAEWTRVELGPGVQWVQIDLGKRARIAAVAMWHDHGDPRIYRDVIVQVSEDVEFRDGVTTIFNNDHDGSSGSGIGKDRLHRESHHGKTIDAKGVRARYVRLYSDGSTADDMNHYTEVEVYGTVEE